MPNPRPLIIGTSKSQQANIGPSINEVLSPSPPVECLSTLGRSETLSMQLPVAIIASVNCEISSGSIPRMKIAIANAAIW